jgi:hypothetical protein
MIDAIGVTDLLRQRLQVSLGARAELGEEIAGGADRRAFAAVTRDGGVPVVVTVHRALPAGPDPDAMQRRVSRLRELGHGVVAVPLAVGDVNGHAWVMEAQPSLPSVRDRLAAGLPPLADGVSAIRDLARALAMMHRRGITHGAIDLNTVRIDGPNLRLGGVGQTLGGSVREDLDALGEVAWALLSGERERRSARSLSSIRRGVAPSLDALCAALHASDPRDRPQSAGAILDALDAVPTRRPNPLVSIVDAGLHDGRPRRAVAWLVVGAAILLLFALLESRA